MRKDKEGEEGKEKWQEKVAEETHLEEKFFIW